MKTLFTIILLLAMSVFASAQDTPATSAYEQKTMFQYGNSFMLNGHKLKLKEVESNLKNFEASRIEFDMYKKNANVSGTLLLVTLATYIGALAVYEKNEGLALGLGIVGFTTNIVAIPISAKSRKHLQKSVWLFNRDVLR